MSAASRCWFAVGLLGSCVVLSCCRETEQPAQGDTAAPRVAERVGSAVCASCHRRIHDSYHDTVAMARAFYPMNPANEVEDWRADNTFFHRASGFHYRMERRGDRYFQRRWTLDPDGRPAAQFEREITHVMGSGNHVRTYVHYADGKATQLPVSWYAETKDWAMSPGYDSPDHWDFHRVIDHGCMFCHNAYPAVPDVDVRGTAYRGELPSGIDCERCHGNGGRHVAVARDDTSTFDEVCATIVNPGNLDPKRAMDVCLQCHLETAVRVGLPHSLRRFDRTTFSFQPGEALEDFLLPFDSATDEDKEERFEIAHHGYRLMQSRCFVESQGELTCTTCHDPHHTPPPADSKQHFRDACLTCHESDDCSTRHAASSEQGIAADDCVQCHMPRRRTIDVVHAVMRDHRIVKRPPDRDLLAAREENFVAYHGDLAFFLPATAPSGPEADLYLGVAYLEGGIQVERGIDMVEQALAGGAPPAATPYHMLGEAKSRKRDFAGALAAFEKALELSPDNLAVKAQIATMLMLTGRLDEAKRHFEQVLAIAPDHADSLVGLYRIANSRSQAAEARQLLERAVRAEPENNQARNVLAQLLLQNGDLSGARRHFEQILCVRPRDVDALTQLGFLDCATGAWQHASQRAQQALRLDAAHQQANLLAANVFALAPEPLLRNGTLAVSHVQKALPANVAASPDALLIAAAAHAENGSFAEAVRIAEAALGRARSGNDARLAGQIDERLRAYRASQPWHAPQ